MSNQNDDHMLYQFASGLALAIKNALFLPAHAMLTVPYWIACKTGLDKQLDKLATKIGFGDERSDPVKLEKWIRDLYADSDDYQVNFNLRDQYKAAVFDPAQFPAAHIPVPANLERGVLHFGRVHNGTMRKDRWLSGQHFNPKLLADAYYKTRGRALLIGGMTCLTASAVILFMLKDFIGFEWATQESWGSLGVANSLSLWAVISSAVPSLLAIAISALPLLAAKRVAKKEHDLMALNETMIDIESQLAAYGANEASKEEISLSGVEGSMASVHSHILAKQRTEFWRVHEAGDPMIYFNKDDGTARARGALHGYEPGTPILITLSDLNQNLLVTGKIGSGKTTGFALPVFDRIIDSFQKAGFPIQGFGLDGKATLYHSLMRILKKRGMSSDRFIPIGVEEGQYGIPIFHGLSVEKCIDILRSTAKGDADPFFVPSALSQIERVLRIAKAYHQTPMGVQYEIESGGCTVDSPEWVKRLSNNPDILYKTITELTECLEGNENLRYALYDPSLKSAIDGCLEDWRNMLSAAETASSVISTINVFLQDFTSNGKILERFGQGRVGPMYKDLALCLEGYYFFSALADTEFGEAARKINIFARSRLYNLITLREIRYKRDGKNPQREPVLVMIDEHHAMVSSGTTGLSDASIMNISRSMGLIFCGMTQSRDAYETVLGKVQTENMTQQMLNRVMLPSKSDADLKWMADNFGTGYRLSTFIDGVAASEGHREMINGGVMRTPRTTISELSRFTPLGMPRTVTAVDKKLINRAEGGKGFFSVLGFFGKRFQFGSGVQYIDFINSEKAVASARYEALMRRHSFKFGEALGQLPDSNIRPSGQEADIEARGRAEGIERTPLFVGNDHIIGGNSRAIISVQQFGNEHCARVELEPMYI
ncbi:hypothetical protein ACSQ5K_26600 [Pseudomonas sp. PhalM4]